MSFLRRMAGNAYAYLSTFLPACLPGLPVCLPAKRYTCLPTCPPACVPAYLSNHVGNIALHGDVEIYQSAAAAIAAAAAAASQRAQFLFVCVSMPVAAAGGRQVDR